MEELVRGGGRAYMLPSFPPSIARRKIALPQKDFFQNTLRPKHYSKLFKRLHHFYDLRRNNKDIRDGARAAEREIAEQVLLAVYQLRELGPNWSEQLGDLPPAQKIWLDDAYIDKRHEESEWADEIANDFARWMIYAYEKTMDDKSIALGDPELAALRKNIRELL